MQLSHANHPLNLVRLYVGGRIGLLSFEGKITSDLVFRITLNYYNLGCSHPINSVFGMRIQWNCNALLM